MCRPAGKLGTPRKGEVADLQEQKKASPAECLGRGYLTVPDYPASSHELSRGNGSHNDALHEFSRPF